MLNIYVVLVLHTIVALLIACLFARRINDKYSVGIVEITLGFSALVFVTSSAAWINSPWLIYGSFFALLIWLTLTRVSKVKLYSIASSFYVFIAVFFILSFFIYIGHGVGIEYRLFVNPDPNGYAVVTGAVDKYGSYPELLKVFEKYTGLPFKYDYNWDSPNQFPLIASPWLIPDSLIKYGIANGFYLHNGISYLALPLLKLVANPIQSFSIIWAFWSLIGASLLVTMVYEICRKAVSKRAVLRTKELVTIALVTISLSLGSFFILIFVIEGFVNQLVSLAQTLCGFLIGLLLIEKQNKREKLRVIIFMLILLTSNWFTYAQQIPFTVFAFLVGLLGDVGFQKFKNSLLNMKNKILKMTAFLFAASIGAFVIFRSQGVAEAFRALTKSAGGGAVHLGAVNPLSALGLNNQNVINVLDTGGSGSAIKLEAIIWPNSAFDNYGWNLVQQGYKLNMTTMNSLKIVLLLLLLFCLSVFVIKSLRQYFYLSVLCVPFILLPYYYLHIRSGNYLKNNQSATFSDYVWMRLLSILGTFTLPLIVTIVSSLIILQIKKRNAKADRFFSFSNVLLIILICFTVLRLGDVYNTSASHIKNSQISYVSKKCPNFLYTQPEPFIITKQIVPELSLSVCAQSLNLLTDSFPVIISTNQTPKNVIRIEQKSSGEWLWANVGTLVVRKEFKTPCNLECLRSIEGFTENTDVKYMSLDFAPE
jgi:hypothetical protein